MRGAVGIYWMATRLVAAGVFVAATFPVVTVACMLLPDRAALWLNLGWSDLSERILGPGLN